MPIKAADGNESDPQSDGAESGSSRDRDSSAEEADSDESSEMSDNVWVSTELKLWLYFTASSWPTLMMFVHFQSK